MVFLGLIAFIAFFLWSKVSDLVPRPMRKFAGVVFCLACLVPWFTWEHFFPRVVDITASEGRISYEFRDPAYAEEFLHLNSDLD